jgi:hypothetical protein
LQGLRMSTCVIGAARSSTSSALSKVDQQVAMVVGPEEGLEVEAT